MEAASKNKKRGRPAILSQDVEKMVSFIEPSVKSGRGKLDVMYRMHALTILVDDPQFSWLCDKKKMLAGEYKWKPGILTELGRFGDEEEIKKVAAQICELKPKKTKNAIRIIRNLRTGKEAKPHLIELVIEIAKAIENYSVRYPNMPEDWGLRALYELIDMIEDEKRG